MNAPSPAGDSLVRLAAVICTRSCPPGTADAVRSVLNGSTAPCLLIVVDQSASVGRDPLAEFADDARLVRIRSDRPGLSHARNIGAAAARQAGAQFVAFTDDDCTAAHSWIESLANTFAAHPEVAMIFGSTSRPAQHASAGVIPSYVPRSAALYRGIVSKPKVEGMGASMAIRLDAWSAVGGFDECLGAGTPLASADDNDMCMRLLHAGLVVAETPRAVVVHHGARHDGAIEVTVAGYMRGTGAACAKMMRLCGCAAIRPLAAIAWRWMRGKSAVDVGTRPGRWLRLRHFLGGAAVGFSMALDARTGRFIPHGAAPQPAA